MTECRNNEGCVILSTVFCVLFSILCEEEITYSTLLICFVTVVKTGSIISLYCFAEGVAVSINIFSICSAATVSRTGVGLHAACNTGRGSGNFTVIPCMLNCTAISVTTVYTLK